MHILGKEHSEKEHHHCLNTSLSAASKQQTYGGHYTNYTHHIQVHGHMALQAELLTHQTKMNNQVCVEVKGTQGQHTAL